MFDKLLSFFDNQPDQLIEYLFIDENRLNSYSEQLKSATANSQAGVLKLGWSPTGPSISGEGSLKNRVTNNSERIKALLKFLQKRNLLHTSRIPDNSAFDSSGNHFFLEQCRATKLLFKVSDSLREHGLKDLAIWLSSPINKPSGNEPFQAEGVFLYLIESYWNKDASAGQPISGRSALAILLEECEEKYKLNLSNIRNSLLFREDDTPPLTLIRQAGFLEQPPRTITALYRLRYLSDDQYVNVAGKTHRCYDLFAYPIFICEGKVAL